ncbi:MAG: hypothetical protein COB45_07755 [Gammaproteobacteria bacterium]|nr:MAG: hypothetical protein COB45_07755 [Gammaproteobacteria bacterium]PHR81292.1 MAG: hypothetical protein COA59_16085 [Colwellia sp.]
MIRARHNNNLGIKMIATFLKHFNSITDPHIERCKKHNLLNIFLLAISTWHKRMGNIEYFEHYNA